MKIMIVVAGTPAPKGSGRAMLIRGKARYIAGGSSVNARKLKSFDTATREAAREAVGKVKAPPFVGKALKVDVHFRLARPAGHWGTGKHAGDLKPSAPPYPITKPDSSKLLRAIEDSLIGIVFDDDSRIVSTRISKRYAEPGAEGAVIIVEPM